MSGAFYTLYGGQFSFIQNGRTALQAQQYAEIAANTLAQIPYANLESEGAHARKDIEHVDAVDWQDEVILGPERIIDEGTNSKQRIATINVYKKGDTQSRFKLQKPLSNQGSGNLPSGSVILWSGFIASIPNGFALCDGNNGTPDLRTRFVVGAGSDVGGHTADGVGWNVLGSGYYAPGNTGGEENNRLTINNLPSHSHTQHEWTVYGDSSSFKSSKRKTGNDGFDAVGTLGNNNLPDRFTDSTGNDQPHNTLPPFYALAYIMKL